MVEVLITNEAYEQLQELPQKIRGRIAEIFERLAAWPEVTGAKPLRGKLAGHFRVRTGDYRVQFVVEGDSVIVEKVGHRDRFYEG
jgi:mRNA-degrading endonuclease RelE of RelBE toxin-antitoxin system